MATRHKANPAAAEADGGDDDLRILGSIRRIIRAVDVQSRRLAMEFQITGPQLVCLLDIVERGPVTATDIAANVHVSASTVVGILDRLEAKGLARRRRDRDDRRLVNVTATDAGRLLIASVPSPMQASVCEALRGLSQRQRAAMADSLERLAALMQQPDGPES